MPQPAFTSPVSFPEVVSYIEDKKDTPTVLKSRHIAAQWTNEARRRAFFSARVASADILSELHRQANLVATGQATGQQARELMRTYFETERGRDLLSVLGFAAPNVDGPISQLASANRLNLIMYQNTKMAQEVGHYRQWAKVADVYPFGIWRIGNAEEHREHHVARDGRVYPYDHPIWTQDPPGGEYNCHCWREEITREEAVARGLSPEPSDADFEGESSLGFDPSAGMDVPIPQKDTWPGAVRIAAQAALSKLPAALTAEELLDEENDLS